VNLNRLDYVIADRGTRYVDIRDVEDGWGDVRVGGGYQLLRDSSRSLALRGLVKLPVGDVDELTGSDGTDVAAWLDYTDTELLARIGVSMTAALGVILLGDGDLLLDQQRDYAAYAHFGVGYALSDAWALKAQLDYESALIDASVDQLGGAALQGTVGVRWQATPKLWLDVALAEDLTPDSTSDAMLQVLFGTRL
jgi:hypothetical protein